MSIKSTLIAACMAATCLSGAASAATLAGDQVSITFIPENLVLGPFTVGAGIDRVLFNFDFDLNAGVDGDEFVFNDDGGFFGHNTSILLSSLNFSGGAVLSGFQILGTSLTNLTFSVSGDNLTFNFDDPGNGPNQGAAIYGRFVTTTASVPLPAALPLMMVGLGGLAALRRRKKVAA